jgi:hypothetical protein
VSVTRVGGSFRDPDGFLYTRDGVLYRQIQPSYAEDWQHFLDSGLGQVLGTRLISHEIADRSMASDPSAHAVIRPTRVPFVTYPYEWTPGQLRDAALLTLDVQLIAMAHGMTLKDASAYNVQFIGHRPVFIDTLSFTRYRDGEAWAAYRQFCQHFLAPLALMCQIDPRLRELLRTHLDGVPLDLASTLLPWTTRLRPAQLIHLHLHARSVARHAGQSVPTATSRRGVSRAGLEGLIGHLASAVRSLKWTAGPTEWGAYEVEHGYTPAGQQVKEAAIARWAGAVRPSLAMDLGANAGHYSERLVAAGAYTVALDVDPGATDLLYTRVTQRRDEHLLPLWVDLANPGPAHGWAHRERAALAERGPADLVMALALVHHLAIGNNVPLPAVASLLARLGTWAIVEWVPKNDPQTQRLLVSRPDIFVHYHEAAFEAAMAAEFRLVERVSIPDSGRILHLLGPR